MNQEVNRVHAGRGSYPRSVNTLTTLAVIGAGMGVLGWLLYLAVSAYFVEPIFCKSVETFAVCKNGGTIAWVAGHTIAAAVALVAMVRLRVYRPLLVIIGVVASLWAAHAWLGGMAWYVGLVWQAVLFAFATMLFGWVARTVNFWAAFIVTVLLVIAARLVLINA